MAITSYPFDNQDTTETQFSWLFRELQDSGVIDSIGGTGLQVTADASGLNVKIAIGKAIVRGHVMVNDAIYTQAIAAANTQPRIDLIVLRLDPSANTITPAVLQGAAAASPIAPTPTQTDTGTYELVIAQVNVAANAPNIGPTDVADKRTYTGTRIGAWTTALRPASPRMYQFGFNTTTGVWEFYNGTAWVRAFPQVWGAGTAFPTGTSPAPLAGDTITRTDLGNSIWRYDGTNWIPTAPIFGKAWRTSNFSAVNPAATSIQVILDASRVRGGVTYANNSFTLPVDGMWRVSGRSYTSGGGAYFVNTWITRDRTAVAQATVTQVTYDKPDAQDYLGTFGDVVPLKAGDVLKFWMSCNAGFYYYGNNEGVGMTFTVEYVGPLNGVTPL